MQPATVLIDANNFYAACEALMDPALIGRPLVVLSNNDGCIVARSAEARALGIAMGQPWFQVRHQLERQGVIVRSSNYALYADMSQRLMDVLGAWLEELEIYSVDEAFGLLQRPAAGDLSAWGQQLRRGVADARALRDMPTGELRRKAGVVGVRLQQELRGFACLPLERLPAAKRETCVSRSFSQPINSLAQLRQAVASYTVRAAEKLRHQHQRAASLTVFVRSSPFAGQGLASRGFDANSATVNLPLASQDTAVLLHKAGVVLRQLQPETLLQQHLLLPQTPEQQQRRRERSA